MTAPLKAIDGNADLPELMNDLAARARAAARVLALASPKQKNHALDAIERAIRAHAAEILAANAEDVAEVRAGGASAAFIDRLTLTRPASMRWPTASRPCARSPIRSGW
jgi:glutamate-5-semialdehyde dehydrogenase